MRNLASCHRAAYDTQPIMVERRPFVPQGAIAAVRSERMGGCPAPRRCMKCHLHSLDLRQSERAEIAAGNVPYAAAKGGVNAITASLAMEYAAHGTAPHRRFEALGHTRVPFAGYGMHAFYVPRSQPDRITVNARCLDNIDGPSLKPTRFFDGRHWEEAQRRRIAEGGHVAAAGLNGAVTLKTILDRAPE